MIPKTMTEKNFSDVSLERRECSHCGAVWMNGVHYWATGASSPGSDRDLAGLVCNTPHGDSTKCINPQLGQEGGDTWEKRLKDLKCLNVEEKAKK